MTRRIRPDALLLVAAIALGYLAVSPAPRDAAALLGASPSAPPDQGAANVPLHRGAPVAVEAQRVLATPAPSSRAAGAPTTRPSARPPVATSSPRRSARPNSTARPVASRPSEERPSAQSTGISTAHVITGYASWYGTGGPGLYAALPGNVDGTHVQVAVCAFPGGRTTCITLPVVTQCGCPGSAVVDLSPPAFRALGVPLSVGLVKVTVEVLR